MKYFIFYLLLVNSSVLAMEQRHDEVQSHNVTVNVGRDKQEEKELESPVLGCQFNSTCKDRKMLIAAIISSSSFLTALATLIVHFTTCG